MKTANGFAQEILERKFNGASLREFNECVGLIEARDAEIRQACASEYQRELNMMETRAIDAEKARDVEHRLWEAVDREGYTLRARIAELETFERVREGMKLYKETCNQRDALKAIIDEARKLAERFKGCPLNAYDVLAVLDRSGARGGSGAASPAPLPDNPLTNTDRSRT